MTESQQPAAFADGGRQRNALVATKFRIPRIQRDLLPRPRLIERLEEATAQVLVLVSTPAGFGKTTLLASWAQNTQKPVAWLSLDGDEDDPARFWRHILATIGRVSGGFGKPALSLLNSRAQPTAKAVVTAVVNELAAQPRELVLVLDDYHLIDSAAVHESLAFLLEHALPGLHIVISSRSDPPIRLARLRASGQLAELRAADLRFTQDETAHLLRRIWEFNLSEENIAALGDRTEGWITGLQLAALSLRGSIEPEQFIQGFTGSNRYILDYLAEEVLERQPEDVQAFLLRTSILDRLNAELCESVLGVEQIACQKILEYLERSNLFLVPLDEQRRWYRYHHLFADLLLARLKFTKPEEVAELHNKAAAWYEANELVGEALQHALAAGDAGRAAWWVERHVMDVMRQGEGETLRGWLAALPEEIVRARPRLALVQAITALNAGRLQVAEQFLIDAERVNAAAPNEPNKSSPDMEMDMLVNVSGSIALVRASLAALRGDATSAIEFVHQAQAHLAEESHGAHISLRWNEAQADWTHGRLAEAGAAFASLVAEGRETSELYLMLTASDVLGRIQRAQGHLEAALRTYQEGLEFATRPGSGLILSAAVAHVGMAEVFYERSQLEPALQHAKEGISLARQLTSTQTLANGLAILAWIRQARGDPAGAWEAMEEAYRVIPSMEIVALHNPVPTGRARLALIRGEVEETERWIRERRLSEKDRPDYADEPEYLLFAGLLLKRNEPARALTLLQKLAAAAKAQERMGSIIEIQVLQALGYQAAGKENQAMKILAQALMQAEPEGYVRTFVDQGRRMAGLLHRALSRGVTANYTKRLLAAFPSVDGGIGAALQPDAPSFNESLSDRELEVLHLLATGSTNREIAEELSIAPTTARKHVSNILGKLGVHNRVQAVSRGRDLGLL